MPHFANREYLYALIIIPFLIFFFILSLIQKKKFIEKFGDSSILLKLMPLASKKRAIFKFAVLCLALSLLIIAVARPQYGAKLGKVKTKGIEIVIALDVSNSMLAQDIKPSRLEAAKRSIDKLVDNLKDDKIGLIIFAGKAFVQVAMTTDYSATKMMLSSINPGTIEEQGTAIGDAIDLAMKSFSSDVKSKKALIIITDGENHEDNPEEMALKAKELGIQVYTIGIGDSKGSPIPSGNGSEFRKDKNGEVIITKLDEELLIKIAQAGNGKYIKASSSNFGLMTLYDDIGKLDKTELESTIYSEYEDTYQYFVFLALFLLLIDFLIMTRKNRQLEKFKLFNLRN